MSEHVSRPANTDSIESLLAELQATRADHCTQLNDLAEVIGIDLIHEHGTMIEAVAALREELDKEQAHSKYLAKAMSRQIDERIAVENQCAYYRTQYTRAETIRKEACEANVKAQTRMLWLEDDNKALRARLEQAEEALTKIAEWTDRYTSPGHPIGTVARAAMQERKE